MPRFQQKIKEILKDKKYFADTEETSELDSDMAEMLNYQIRNLKPLRLMLYKL